MAIQITGIGSYIPKIVMKNEDFLGHKFYTPDGEGYDEQPEVIIRKFEKITGIVERRYASKDLSVSDIAAKAAKKAITHSGVDPGLVTERFDLPRGDLHGDQVRCRVVLEGGAVVLVPQQVRVSPGLLGGGALVHLDQRAVRNDGLGRRRSVVQPAWNHRHENFVRAQPGVSPEHRGHVVLWGLQELPRLPRLRACDPQGEGLVFCLAIRAAHEESNMFPVRRPGRVGDAGLLRNSRDRHVLARLWGKQLRQRHEGHPQVGRHPLLFSGPQQHPSRSRTLRMIPLQFRSPLSLAPLMSFALCNIFCEDERISVLRQRSPSLLDIEHHQSVSEFAKESLRETRRCSCHGVYGERFSEDIGLNLGIEFCPFLVQGGYSTKKLKLASR